MDGDISQPGGSAHREYAKRRARDEARIRAEWGRFGNIAVALTPERASTRAWSTGAAGEVRVGGILDRLGSDVRVLHDRRIRGTRANIDHLVVTRSAVWVIDAKKYSGRPERLVEGGLFSPRREKLLVGRRDRTKLVEGVQWQIERVSEALPGIPVRGALCFVDSDWGLFASAFSVQGVDVVWPKRIPKLLATSGGGMDVEKVAGELAAAFRPA